MVRQLGNAEDFPLTAGRYGIAISWDQDTRKTVDVDLQAVIIDNKGQVVDAVYYNNMKAFKCVTHSGDEVTGAKSGYDEMIWVGLGKLPAHIHMVVFVVAAFAGGQLRDAKNGKVSVLEESKENEVASFSLEESSENVDVVAMMVRSDSQSWILRMVDLPAQEGQHFIDILEPTIGSLVRSELPHAPKRLKVAFAMEKGAVVDLPRSDEIKQVTAGLGWDTGKGNVDLDVSAVLFNASGESTDAIFFGNLEGCGLQHSGDNLTGEGAGDDEQIKINMEAVSDWVRQIFVCVNIYTNGKTFQQVANPYCRIMDSAGSELARYELKEAGAQNGLIIARLFRDGSGVRWGFQAIGTFCRGRTWKDSVGQMAQVFHTPPREIQLRGASTFFFSGENATGAPSSGTPRGSAAPTVAGAAPAPPVAASPPLKPAKSSTCALM